MITDVIHYLTAEGEDLYQEWLNGLSDRVAMAKITTRINRLSAGNRGDCRPVGQGVWELRIHQGGYRVYYAQAGHRLLLLLSGGDKRKQQSDITAAIEYWNDYLRR